MIEHEVIKTKRRPRKIWSKEERKKLLAGFESSDMSAWAYAKSHGVAPNSFYIWIKKEANPTNKKPSKFAKVELSPVSGNSLTAVTLRNGLKLEFCPSTPMTRIKELVEGLLTC